MGLGLKLSLMNSGKKLLKGLVFFAPRSSCEVEDSVKGHNVQEAEVVRGFRERN